MILRLTSVIVLLSAGLLRAQTAAPEPKPAAVFAKALLKVADLLQPPKGAAPKTFSTRLRVVKSEGAPKELLGRELELSFQAPDMARMSAVVDGSPVTIGRLGQQFWVHVPAKQFALIGKPGLLRFDSNPDSVDHSTIKPIYSPLTREQLMLVPFFSRLEPLPSEEIGGEKCHVFRATPQAEIMKAFKLPEGSLQFWIRQSDSFPAQIAYLNGGHTDVRIELVNPRLEEPWAKAKWALHAATDERVEEVAVSHLARFVRNIGNYLSHKMPAPLGPATGERRILATEGEGRLEIVDGTKVLFLKGTPEEMGHQHGTLLKNDVRNLVERVLYGVGVGSSFAKGRWFFNEIEEAQARQAAFVDARYVREMDAIALAAGVSKEEARLANYFPELFHCSGFALYGDATEGGRMYHGRILDYMKGVGLEQNAVVMVFQPDVGHAWVNISYAGFVGSVTAMNEKQISIGEMGGRGEGKWDGKPMAQLVREVMEKAGTLDEAVEIMRRGPRTCEYYYVIADGKTKRAVGIAATPDTFQVIQPGEVHPQLPHPFKDAVLMSAGDRYEELSRRVKSGFGKFDESKARDLMTRPVCMNSNIHSVLFAPDTLDFWVANADSENVASHARYTHYNLRDLLAGTLPTGGQ